MSEDNHNGVPTSYPFSVKIESTSRGYRIHVHVYSATADTARDEAVKLLTGTLIEMESKRLTLAPMEGRA